jgi:hypothetical protein
MHEKWFWSATFRMFPPWTCPTCQRGRLRVHQEYLAVLEPGESQRAHYDQEAGFESYYKRFSALLRCDDPGCEEVASIAGDIIFEPEQDEDGSFNYVEAHYPRAFLPAPLPFNLDRRIEPNIAKLVRNAANALWGDIDNAANKLRQVVSNCLHTRRCGRTGRLQTSDSTN